MLVSYGISVDKEAHNRDRVVHTAARVGLSVHPDAAPYNAETDYEKK